MGSVLIQKEHGSERAPAFTPVQMWKESAETLARSVQGYDLGLAFLSWARFRNTSCFNSLFFFFWDNTLAMGTSPEEELFVQSLLFLTTSGQYNLTGTYPAAWEAELKGSTEKQAGTVLHTQAVRSSREKLLCTNKVC